VVLRVDGHCDFEALLTRDGAKRASYIAFDLLRHDGKDIRLIAIEKRRAALKQLVADAADGLLFSEAIEAEGALVFAEACKLGLEGIVSKRAGSLRQQAAVEKVQKPGVRQNLMSRDAIDRL
jgi:bifunctional non-homologous end joining protein LigD